jgi:hypothetical protein
MQSQLVAFKIFRRIITAAIFSGTRLQFLDLQHLSNDPDKASETLDRFVGWTLENFHPEIAALSVEEEDDKPRAAMLAELVKKRLLSDGVPIWKVTDEQLLEAYATPALTQKHNLRLIARSIWPDNSSKLPALDAALVGLYVQTERLLSNH